MHPLDRSALNDCFMNPARVSTLYVQRGLFIRVPIPVNLFIRAVPEPDIIADAFGTFRSHVGKYICYSEFTKSVDPRSYYLLVNPTDYLVTPRSHIKSCESAKSRPWFRGFTRLFKRVRGLPKESRGSAKSLVNPRINDPFPWPCQQQIIPSQN